MIATQSEMMRVHMIIALLCMLWPSVVMAQWAHQPEGATVIVDCPFNDITCGPGHMPGGTKLWDVHGSSGHTLNTIQDGTAPLSPTSTVRASLFYPALNGGGELIHWHTAASRELYVGVWFKVNPDWQQNSVGANKFMFMRSFNNGFGHANTNGVFLVRGNGNPMSVTFSHNTGGTDNSHACATDLGLTCFSNMSSGAIFLGKWHKIEACIRSSTNITARDGIFAWWVDDVLAGKYTNVNYGNGNVNEWLFAQTWDGHGNAQGRTRDVHQYLDHVRVAVVPSGGCAKMLGSATPVDTPPASVNGVTVNVK